MMKAMFLMFLGIFLVLGVDVVSAYVIAGDAVIEDNAKATILQYPHTLTRPDQNATIVIKSKLYTGDIDIVFGFDSDNVLPKYGMVRNESGWNDISGKFNRIDREYNGFDRWYYYKGFHVDAGEEYSMRMGLDVKETGDGKYWICIKPSHLSMQDAISDGKFMCLDPWYNINFTKKIAVWGQTTQGSSQQLYLINDTSLQIVTSQELMWCNFTVNTSFRIIGYVYYNNPTDYICLDDTETEEVTILIDEGNSTDNQTGLDRSLLGFYTLNDTNIIDHSIYDVTGVNITNIAAIPAQIGNGINFSGNSYFDIPGIYNNLTFEGTIMLWARRFNDSVNPCRNEKKNDANNFLQINMHNSGGSVRAIEFHSKVGAADRIRYLTSPGIYEYDEWNYYAFVWNSSEFSMYMNGTNVTKLVTSTFVVGGVGGFPSNMRFGEDLSGSIDCFATFDMIQFWNRSFSADDILAAYRNQKGSLNFTSVGSEVVNDFTINITSPLDGASFTNATIPLTWGFISLDGSTCASSTYSIDGGANVSTGCSNITFTASELDGGTQILTLYVTSNNGTLKSDSSTYSVVFGGNFTVNIYDEMDGSFMNISNHTVTLKAFCDNDTESVNITSSSMPSVIINCTFNRLVLDIINSTGSLQGRALIPSILNGTLDFYMINETNKQKISQTWQIYDLSGVYSNGIIQLIKVIPVIGQQVITQQHIDAEDKVFMDLIIGETYIVSIFDSEFENERSIGGVETTTSTAINIEVSNVPFQTDARIPARDVLISFSWDKDSRVIRVLYNDTLSETVSVGVTIYNGSNISQVLFGVGSQQDVVTFTYSNVDVNTTFIVEVTAVHSRYGTLVETKTVDFSDTGLYTIEGLESTGNGIWMAISAGMIIIFVSLSFSKKNAKFGIASSAVLMALFMFFGWFNETPYVAWGMITLLVIVSASYIFSLGRRFN